MIKKDIPVSMFIALSIIVVFLLFNAQVVTAIPCGESVHHVFMRKFVHVDYTHLVSNLYALYAISRVEQEMGFKSFIYLLIFLLSFNTLTVFISKHIWKDLKCSIGFSGILFGLMTWEIVSKKSFDVELIFAILVMTVTPSLKRNNISLSGHAIGAFSGITAGILWKYINNIKT
jgi:membrane associated rhomboid family serine protease